MNQSTHSEPTPNAVSTVTKHIKIYSDNPIHDCIDRIICACECIDEGGQWAQPAAVELNDAAAELTALAMKLRVKYHYERLDKFNGNIQN